MSILLDTPTTADYDLADSATILWHTMVAAGDVRVVVRVGTVVKPCVALAGVWELFFYVNIGGTGYSIEPAPQQILTSDSTLKLFVSKVSDVSAGTIVGVRLTSPNAGDTEVTVTAEIWHVSGSLPAAVPNAAGGLMTFGTGAGQINPDGTGKVPSSNAALAASYTADRAGKLDNLNVTVGSRSSHSAADVWTSGTRTLSSFGTLVADIATAVWGAVARTLTTLSGLGHATATGQDEIKAAVGLVGNSEDTIENSESQVYNTDTADGSTVVNEES